MRLDPGRAGEYRQDLAGALHRLRRASGLSGERLARRCGRSQSKVSRIETGRLLPSVVDVEQMLNALGADQPTKSELLTLLTESAIRWQLCPPAVMALQLDRLVSLSQLPTVRIGVLPLDTAVPDGAYHTFVTYDRRLATVELFSGQLVLRDPRDIDHYRNLFEFFAERAIWSDDARQFLSAVAEGFRSRR